MKFKKFDIKDKSKFSYWFWHWLAYNYTAVKLHAWRPKFLLHDIEKPWLKLIWRDYDKVKNGIGNITHTIPCMDGFMVGKRWIGSVA